MVGDSPYAGRVVALVDRPRSESHKNSIEGIRKVLGDRLFELDKASLEEYIWSSMDDLRTWKSSLKQGSRSVWILPNRRRVSQW
jgi:hypothetical protein